MIRDRDKPMMADCEIAIITSILETQQPVSVLEWGAGGSTVYWPGRCDSVQRWLSVEGNRDYYEHYLNRVGDKVELRLALETSDYLLEGTDETFDFILVDGRHRIECLNAAKRLLANKGVVVLHDSGREAYRGGWWRRHEILYLGELLTERGDYKHRGVTVFWQDSYVRKAGWLRDYVDS